MTPAGWAMLHIYQGDIDASMPYTHQALATLGETRTALDELRWQVDGGWRIFWRWDTELNPNFASLRDEPEFKTLVEFLHTDMAQQRQSLRALEASGDIRSPPLPGTR